MSEVPLFGFRGWGLECTESVPDTESDGATGKGGASTAADDAEGSESPFEDRTAPAHKRMY